MPDRAVIERVAVRTARISAKTDWTFVLVACSDGIVGLGEATLSGAGDALFAFAPLLERRLVGRPAMPNAVLAVRDEMRAGLVQAAVSSAAEQALWDAEGQRQGRSVADLLGGSLRERVPLYANVNRGIERRTPEGFAAAANRAVAAGYDAVKIAPFDGLDEPAAIAAEPLFSAGLERIEATCDVVRGRARVMVDCHWRLDERLASRLLDAAARLDLFWIECPLPEAAGYLPALRRVRGKATEVGVRLAGMEKGTCLADFAPYLAEGLYDVLMPDVKYVGGLAATRHLAALAAESGVLIAPHNPSGPVCHAASVQVAATLANLLFLEVQFEESPLFETLVDAPILQAGGTAPVAHRPGLGLALDEAVMAEVEIAQPST